MAHKAPFFRFVRFFFLYLAFLVLLPTSDSADQTRVDSEEQLLSPSPALFVCPENSYPHTEEPQSFSDCTCEAGYQRSGEGEDASCDFFCPDHSSPKDPSSQPSSFSDCQCDEGFTADLSAASSSLPSCYFACPAHATSSVSLSGDLSGCSCQRGFTLNHAYRACEFTCPAFMVPKPHILPQSIEDCECAEGYEKAEGEEGEGEVCRSRYSCPAHSSPHDHQLAPRSFDDCTCDHGYQKISTQGPIGKERCHPVPVSTFACPEFSRPHKAVARSIEDCQCQDGYELEGELCLLKKEIYRCPEHASSRLGVGKEKNFSDCACVEGYRPKAKKEECEEVLPPPPFECPAGTVARRWPPKALEDCLCPSGEEVSKCKREERKKFLVEKRRQSVCPPSSFLVQYPVKNAQDDCHCRWGYHRDTAHPREKGIKREKLPFCLPDTPGLNISTNLNVFHCPPQSAPLHSLPKDLSHCACQGGRRLSKVTNLCEFPMEEVLGSTPSNVAVNGSEVAYQLVGGNIMVTQGDIAIGESLGLNHQGGHVFKLRGMYADKNQSFWNNETICYAIDPSIRSKSEVIHSAMHHIRATTGFQFLNCDSSSSCTSSNVSLCKDYLLLYHEQKGPFSYVGKRGGEQKLGVHSEASKGTLLHLLLHAIGLHHEHNREDRDMYLQINWECVGEREKSFFAVDAHCPPLGPYDFESIMHAPLAALVDTRDTACLSVMPRSGAFSLKNGSDVFLSLQVVGQRETLSLGDVSKVLSLYPRLAAVKKDAPPRLSAYKELAEHSEQSMEGAEGVLTAINALVVVSIVVLATSLFVFGAKKAWEEAEEVDQTPLMASSSMYQYHRERYYNDKFTTL